ncbi:major facilitator superfamily domain-containing protein [Aspergillus avenaceus]|uniref:Major facilitator superfamily domain-containing protein n=1 Tax=Aspergillus avenaceus TaxID=36643 RepID=A0A5N6U6Z1_ASPAV|nr:major facilitator superfamily domain-containing protein [Aspergillus avenaceus]
MGHVEKDSGTWAASIGSEKELRVDANEYDKAPPADIAQGTLQGTTDHLTYTDAENKAVLRKIDFFLLPLMMVTYCIQYLDKSCISYAALWGMKQEAHLVGDQYSWLTTIFYIGYLVGEFPMNVLFQKLHITRCCGILIFLWGAVLLCMAAAHSFSGLMAVRFFLGVLESGVSPCFVQLTSMFWKRTEQPLRTGIWFCMNGIAQIFGGLVAYGIGHIKSEVPNYKFPFLIFGAITVVWAVPFFLFAAPSPASAKWLSPAEKDVAVKRVAENKTGLDNKEFKTYQAREALVDPQVWILILFVIANNIPNGGISAFGPLIIEGFGYSKLGTTLLGMPFGGAQIIALISTGFLAGTVKNCRIILMCGGLAVAILGMSLMYGLPEGNKLGRLFGYYLSIGFSPTYVLSLGLIQANIAGRTKKTVVTAALFIAYCVGNLIGPQLFFEHEEPHYRSGFIAIIICLVVDLVLLLALRKLYVWKNKKRDAAQSAADHAHDDSGLTDLTDMENLSFRYVI